MADNVIEVAGISKQYRLGQIYGYKTLRESLQNLFRRRERPQGDYIWALKKISFEVQKGETIGIIGKNGAGKTTLLKILTRITEPTEGMARLRGRVSSLLEVGTGFHPELTGRENIFLNGAILGMKRGEVRKKFDEIVSFSEIEKFIDTPVKRYSSGMYVRLAFAVAAHLEPDILLVDEVLAVGDASFQKKCMGKMESVAGEGRTVLFVSHNMAAVSNLCKKTMLLEDGRIKFFDSTQKVVDTYLAENLQSKGEVIFSEDRCRPKSELNFLSVRLLDPETKDTCAYAKLTRGIILQIEYQVLQPVSFAQIGFELWNATGTCVLCSTDFDQHPENSHFTRQPGRYRTSCYIPSTFLRPGHYWITIASSVPGIRMLDIVDKAIFFETLDTGSVESKLAQGRRGVIAPVLEWKNELLETSERE